MKKMVIVLGLILMIVPLFATDILPQNNNLFQGADAKYELLKKDYHVMTMGIIGNLVPSLGSWIIGDYTGAIIIDALLVATIVFTIGAPSGTSFFILGSSLTYIVGFVSPSIYVYSYNENLKKKILIENNININIISLAF